MDQNKIYSIYFYLFAAILTLPLIIFPPFVTSPDWDKTIVFRCLLSSILAVFIWQTCKNRTFSEIKQKIKSVKIPFWALISILTTFFLATIFSQDVSFSLWGSPYRAGGFITFSFYLIFAVLSFLIIKPEDWKKLLNWSIIVGWLVGLIAVFQNFSIFSNFLHPYQNSPPSTTGNSSFLAIYILLLFFITLGLFLKNNSKALRIFYGATLVFFFFVILVSSSRSAYLGLFAGFLYFLFFYPVRNLPSQTSQSKNGGQISNGAYPQKNKKVRIARIVGIFLVLSVILFVIYINITPQLPSFLQDNSVVSRLSLKLLAGESRFSAWEITLQAIKNKPVLGWGPENLQIGFNKYYNPALPQISTLWWDRAHNIFLDTAVSEGILGLAAYLFFFAILFWQLQKAKKQENGIHAHMLQAAILAYFVTDFFSFDSFVTYIILFLIVGYSFSLIKNQQVLISTKTNPARKNNLVGVLILALLFVFILFFNILPYNTGRAVGLAEKLQSHGDCQGAAALMEKTIKGKNYASTYAKEKYGEILKRCGLNSNIKQGLLYMKRGAEVLKDASILNPKSANLWVVLSDIDNILRENESDPQKQQQLSQETKEFIKKGLDLSPKRQELIMEEEKIFVLDKNYSGAISLANECIKIYDQFGACYWYAGVANIYLGNQEQGTKQIILSRGLNFEGGLSQLADAYLSQNNYPALRDVYDTLVRRNPEIFEYRAYLAFALKITGDYKAAREQALEVIRLGTEDAIKEAKAFIKTLPPPYNTLLYPYNQ